MTFAACAANNQSNKKDISHSYLPTVVNDTFVFACTVKYAINLKGEKFDTTYIDSIKIIRTSNDLFHLNYREMRYKLFKQSEEEPDIQLSKTYTELKIQRDSLYHQQDVSPGSDYYDTLRFAYPDSIIFNQSHTMNPSDRSETWHYFGKKIK